MAQHFDVGHLTVYAACFSGARTNGHYTGAGKTTYHGEGHHVCCNEIDAMATASIAGWVSSDSMRWALWDTPQTHGHSRQRHRQMRQSTMRSSKETMSNTRALLLDCSAGVSNTNAEAPQSTDCSRTSGCCCSLICCPRTYRLLTGQCRIIVPGDPRLCRLSLSVRCVLLPSSLRATELHQVAPVCVHVCACVCVCVCVCACVRACVDPNKQMRTPCYHGYTLSAGLVGADQNPGHSSPHSTVVPGIWGIYCRVCVRACVCVCVLVFGATAVCCCMASSCCADTSGRAR